MHRRTLDVLNLSFVQAWSGRSKDLCVRHHLHKVAFDDDDDNDEKVSVWAKVQL